MVVVRYGNTQVRNDGRTMSVSSRGVLMTVNVPVTIGDSVEYFMLLTAGEGSRAPVVLHCVGTVVRTGTDMVAVTIERYELQRNGNAHPWQTGQPR